MAVYVWFRVDRDHLSVATGINQGPGAATVRQRAIAALPAELHYPKRAHHT